MKSLNSIILCKSVFIVALILSGCEEQMEFDEPGNLVPMTVEEDPLLPGIEINGTILHAESFGDISNPIIIFLHGGPGSDYRAFISQKDVENASRYPDERSITNGGLSQLQDEYYCVFYDQRGAGLSPRYDLGDVTFEKYIKDLDAIIDYYLNKKYTETGVLENQVNIIGWSYGGTLSTGYINRYPERIKNIVLYEPAPFSKKAYDYFKENTTPYTSQIGYNWLEEFLLSHDHFTTDSHIRIDYQMLLGAFRSNPQFHENGNTPLWRMGALLEGEDLQDENRDNTSNLSAFKGEFLFIGGELTINEYPEYPAIQMSYYPHSEYVEIKGVGHTGPWEKPEEIAAVIRNFFQNN